MVTYEDFATYNTYRFLTNHWSYEAQTIQIFIESGGTHCSKQHLHIKTFYYNSENNLYTKIGVAMCSFLVLALTPKYG